jgi:serine/threonine-protein kinase RsbW
MFGPEQVPPRCEFETDKLVIKLDAIIPSNTKIIDSTVTKIVGLIGNGYSDDELGNIDLALREALVNAIIHGNHSDPKKAVRICVALQSDCGVLIVVQDSGAGFDFSQVPNPVIAQNLLAGHGRGIFLINQLMEDVRFNFEHGTAIHMRRKPPSQS